MIQSWLKLKKFKLLIQKFFEGKWIPGVVVYSKRRRYSLFTHRVFVPEVSRTTPAGTTTTATTTPYDNPLFYLNC